MGTERLAGIRRLKRDTPALVAAVLVAALAGSGPAAAAAWPGGARAAHAGPAAGGLITTVAGGIGGPARATTVALFRPCGVSFGNGRLYIADESVLRAVNPGTDRLTAAAGGFFALLGDGGPATNATLDTCAATVDHSGNLVIADIVHLRIRVAAAKTGSFYGRAMTAGHIYTVAGNGTFGFSGDAGPATSAEMKDTYGVAVDAAGNLVVADTENSRIRVVAVKTGTFYGKAMTAGDIYTVAGSSEQGFSGDGGPATSAELEPPEGVAVDIAGNLVIGDEFNQRVRVVAVKTGTFYAKAMTAGDIYTVAGNGKQGFAGDGGPAASAELDNPQGVAADAAGNLLIADSFNNRIRAVAAKTGTFYGKAMTAGHIYTLAGNGTGGVHAEATEDPPSGPNSSSRGASRWTHPATWSSPTPGIPSSGPAGTGSASWPPAPGPSTGSR